MRFAPALSEQTLIEGVWVVWLARAVRDRLQRLRRVFGAKVVWIFILKRKAEPNVEEIGKFGVVHQTAERRISDDQV